MNEIKINDKYRRNYKYKKDEHNQTELKKDENQHSKYNKQTNKQTNKINKTKETITVKVLLFVDDFRGPTRLHWFIYS